MANSLVPYFNNSDIKAMPVLFVSAGGMKEQKQVRVYQWHSLVPYFNNSDIKAMPVLFSFSAITGEGTEAGACLPVALSCVIFQQQ